ncbi:helix-turn-helix transcriptional regulator [Zavarzinia compransoris]|uniref:helix-turn-helix transcriptional regulator n=1 Tax=Zavarzinia compransoris TaxID=1264899 RepID=UPI001414FE65|nr:helix-turn-helix transcriptional regulator [Zavarzinia compransoris]
MQIGDWHARTPDLVSMIGREGFPASLDRALATVAPFDISCVFAYPGQDRPLLLHDGLNGVSPAAIMDNYLNGTYLLDAVYAACRRRVAPGLYRLRDLAPDAFFDGDYFKSPAVHPCISMETGTLAEEIVFIAPLAGDLSLAYSLMRQHGNAPFAAAEMERLRAAAPMVGALMARHWHHLAARHSEGQRTATVEAAFRSFRQDRLTPREQTVVSLILRGHSSLSIARTLEIAEGTVKIHRKHIHAKLGISSQTELFNLFIEHLMGQGGDHAPLRGRVSGSGTGPAARPLPI